MTSTTNRNLSSSAQAAIKRVRDEQQFKLALEHLIQHDAQSERESSVWALGYASDFVSLGALAGPGGAATASPDSKKTDGDDNDGIVALEAKAAAEQEAKNKKQQQHSSSDEDDEEDVDDAKQLPRRRQRRGDDHGAGIRAVSLWNSDALDRPCASSVGDWKFLGGASGKTSNKQPQPQQQQQQQNVVDDTLTDAAATSGEFDGGDLFQWFRSRSKRCEHVRDMLQRQNNLTPEELAKRVLL